MKLGGAEHIGIRLSICQCQYASLSNMNFKSIEDIQYSKIIDFF